MGQKLEFEWDTAKNTANQQKHCVSFSEAEQAFYDPARIVLRDIKHSGLEDRFFCYGIVKGHILTVRFTMRAEKIRIIGAAYWRDGKNVYEKENNI